MNPVLQHGAPKTVHPSQGAAHLTSLAAPQRELLAERYQPVSDTSGRISKIFVNLRSRDCPSLHAEMSLIKAIAQATPGVSVVAGIPDGKRATPTWPPGAASEQEVMSEMLSAHGISATLVPLEDRVWARDLGLWADNGDTFVIPAHPFSRGIRSAGQIPPTDEKIAALKAALGTGRIAVTSIQFEGGDFIATDSAVYAGYSCFRGDRALIACAEERLGKPIRELGNEEHYSPYPHLDCGVVFISDRDAFIGDPRKMASILRSLSHVEFKRWEEEVADWYQGKENVSWGACRPDSVVSREIIRDISFIDTPGKYGYGMFRRSLPSCVEMYDNIERQLEGFGVNVIKIPAIDFGFPLGAINGIPDVDQGVRRFFGFRLGCAAVDEETEAIITASRKVDSFISTGLGWPFVYARGGNRCVANVLRS